MPKEIRYRCACGRGFYHFHKYIEHQKTCKVYEKKTPKLRKLFRQFVKAKKRR